MALFDNRIKTSQSARLYQKAISLLHKNMLLGLVIFWLIVLKTLKPYTSDNDLLLEGSGGLYSVTNKIAFYFDDGFKSLAKYFASAQALDSLDSENKLLRQEISLLNDKIVDLEVLQQYNVELKRLLNFVSLLEVNYVSARLLSIVDSAQGPYGLISCGKDSGIAVGDMVVSDKGLIGKIAQVSRSFAKVLLVTNSKFRTPIITSSGQKAILVGDQLQPYILYLKNIAEVKIQDLIVTLGDKDSLLVDIPVGKVSNIEDKVYLKFTSDIDNVNFVSVLKMKKDESYDSN